MSKGERTHGGSKDPISQKNTHIPYRAKGSILANTYLWHQRALGVVYLLEQCEFRRHGTVLLLIVKSVSIEFLGAPIEINTAAHTLL